jgi:small-conductance mechanosensitive channel
MKKTFLLITLISLLLIPGKADGQTDTLSKNTPSTTIPRGKDSLAKSDSLKDKSDSESQNTIVVISSSASEDSLALEALTDTLKSKQQKGVAISLKGQKLFSLYSSLGDFTPEERAKRVEKLLNEILVENKPIDSIKIINGQTLATIRVGNQVIMSITDTDARKQNLSRLELAEINAQIIKDFFNDYRDESDFYSILLKLILAIGLFILLIYLWKWLTNFFNFLADQIPNLKDRFIPSIRFKNIELLSSERVSEGLVLFVRLLSVFIKFTLIYSYLTAVFGLFLWTRGLAQTLIDVVMKPALEITSGIINYLPNLITIAVIIIIFKYILNFADLIYGNIAKGELKISGFYQEWADPTRKITKFIIILTAIVLIYPYTPIADSQAAQGISIFLSILFALGSTSAISNIIASLMLNYTRNFKSGDRIKIEDIVGDIVEKTLLVTKIRTIKNEEVSLPNSKVMNANIINYSEIVRRGGTLILHAELTIGYDVPWQRVHECLIQAALKTDRVLEDPKPYVLQTGLGDYYPTYQINAHTKDPKRAASIYSNLFSNIQDEFNQAGIEILSPAYRVNRLDNKTSIPEEYRTKDYQPSPVHVRLETDSGKLS